MRRQTGRYSVYIRPFSYIIDLCIINLLAFYFLSDTLNIFNYHVLISISWVFISWNSAFYEVYRYTKFIQILTKILKQYVLFIILNFAYSGYFLEFFEPSQTIKFVTTSLLIISSIKLFIYFFLKKFRVVFGGNFRRVVIIGSGKASQELAAFFKDNPDYGYKLVHVFDTLKFNTEAKDQYFTYILSQNIDEVYCSLSDLDKNSIDQFVDFTDNNLKVLKLLPAEDEILSLGLSVDYYGYIPIITLRNIPLDDYFNKTVKRFFDIGFSTFVIVGVLSWLVPILAILIKIESKGPIFFKQKRNGLNYKEFSCYKFRSMTLNEIADLEQVSKNDPRITKVGRFLRKSSIDELPQFINVLFGEMSVVGPRPHMVSHTEMYARSVDKFMVRHFIKPGITGLAQTNGFRGEVETHDDIINRVKYDIFYVENWSLLLDVKIIITTLINAIKGEEKAY